jgi:hypothetical protein
MGPHRTFAKKWWALSVKYYQIRTKYRYGVPNRGVSETTGDGMSVADGDQVLFCLAHAPVTSTLVLLIPKYGIMI